VRRDIFSAEHADFRSMVREFVTREIVPHYPDWERAGEVPGRFFRELGAIGVMGMAIPEKFGGSGHQDYRYNVILQEEASRALVTMGIGRLKWHQITSEDAAQERSWKLFSWWKKGVLYTRKTSKIFPVTREYVLDVVI
jgi:acyl-CoA dehydrogenase